jgi:hypothetical protein
MALRRFCVRLAPDFMMHHTRTWSVGHALSGLGSRCSFATSDGEFTVHTVSCLLLPIFTRLRADRELVTDAFDRLPHRVVSAFSHRHPSPGDPPKSKSTFLDLFLFWDTWPHPSRFPPFTPLGHDPSKFSTRCTSSHHFLLRRSVRLERRGGGERQRG